MKVCDWFLFGNDCSTCKYCWEERTSYEYEEYDCGCYIKGVSYLDKKCFLIPPIKNFLGFFAKRRAAYYFNHGYDGFYEFSELQTEKDLVMESILNTELLQGRVICWKSSDGELHMCDTEQIIKNKVWKIRNSYEDKFYPSVYVSLGDDWKRLIRRTFKFIFNRTFGLIKPFICK